jgi:TolB protein
VIVGRRKRDRYFGLWIVDVARASARRITPDEWEAQYPAWSPDGKSIAFTKVVPPDDFSIFVIRPDGSGLRRLSTTDNNDNYAAWSPDGQRLAFHSERTPRAGLWIMDADGSGERFLSEGGEPQWEPGRWIIFNCALSSESARVCAIPPNGKDATLLPLDRQAAFPNWLP